MKEDTWPDEAPEKEQAIDAAMEIDDAVQDEVVETRDQEIERLRSAAAEAEKRVLMAQAEAENFRKRMRLLSHIRH